MTKRSFLPPDIAAITERHKEFEQQKVAKQRRNILPWPFRRLDLHLPFRPPTTENTRVLEPITLNLPEKK